MLLCALVTGLTAGLPGRAPAYEEADVSAGGVLAGTVKFSGRVPKFEPIPVKKNQDVCGTEKQSEALVVGPDGGVKNGVVLIEGITRGKKAQGGLVLDNRDCLFAPHVGAVMVGTKARVKNSDPILHNTHGYLDRLTVFNLALPLQNQVIDITRRLRKPGIVKVLCDAHTHMFAWIVVHDNPYLAVTDEHGRFAIEGIPPGTYEVTLWHEGFVPRGFDRDGRPLYDEPRKVSRKVTVPAGGKVSVEFVLE